jgi:NADH:ubiquinone reductase (H+-translocating)
MTTTTELDHTRVPTVSSANDGARPRVVIVGAGFGGLSAARELASAPVDVLVLDRNNYHGFWPFLYQVATGILETQEIAYPVRSMLRKQRNVDFLMADVIGVDFDAREVLTDSGAYRYDYLVLAGGSATNFFGNDELAEHCYGLKDLEDADQLRNHILTAFEAAAQTDDPERRAALLSFVIVGGGPTGVELAGQLSLLAKRTLSREFPSLDLSQTRVVLINAGDAVLETFPERLRADAARRLEKMGVELMLSQVVESVNDGVVQLADGTQIGATTVVWAAGVRACGLARRLNVPVAQGGRVPVTPELNLAAHPEVFVIGDMAFLEAHKDGRAYPMVAQVAMQQGRQAARNMVALECGRPPRAFRYFDKGQMATIGRRCALVDGFGVRLRGVPAWIVWLVLHLAYLRGIRNRLVVLLDWIAVYASRTRATAVITRPELSARVEQVQHRVLAVQAMSGDRHGAAADE